MTSFFGSTILWGCDVPMSSSEFFRPLALLGDPFKFSSPKRLYIFLYNYPENGKLILPGYAGKINYAQFLNDKSELLYKPETGNDLVLTLPVKKLLYEIPVVELTIK